TVSHLIHVFLLHFHPHHRDLHSFPTRRSSDLYRANDDRLATVRGVHEGLLEYGVYHGGSVAGQPGRSRRCVAGSFPESLRTLCRDRKSTRLISSPVSISYAVFCLKKKNNNIYAQDNLRVHFRDTMCGRKFLNNRLIAQIQTQ